MKAVRAGADTHGQPAVMLLGDQTPRHRQGVNERDQGCGQRPRHIRNPIGCRQRALSATFVKRKSHASGGRAGNQGLRVERSNPPEVR